MNEDPLKSATPPPTVGPKPRIPYRRMPPRYIAVWILLSGLATLYQTGVPHDVVTLAGLAIGAVLGGLLWGWILWRVGLYKAFPDL
jgi:hypothetical protein